MQSSLNYVLSGLWWLEKEAMENHNRERWGGGVTILWFQNDEWHKVRKFSQDFNK